jgi:hypothetical protein
MNAMEIQNHAQKLYTARGQNALAEAAEKVRQFEKTGDSAQVQDWRQIETALKNLSSPRAS